jgi:hypothetical protein
MDEQQTQKFATDWIAAWNAHDVEAILSHYADNVEYTSSFVKRLADASDGTLHGSEAVRAYVQNALEAFPILHFELIGTFVGADSVVLHYRSVNNLIAAEYFQFDAQGKVVRLVAHYSA